jgi:site-specific DNA-methyltransferase (adenine-specific)
MTNQLYLGDCLEILDTLAENSVDTCITDPPYGLGFMGKEWDTFDKSQFGIAGNEGENDLKVKKNFKVLPRYNNGAGLYDFTLQWATEVYRVLKPGGLLLAFGGTRTYHRLVCGIEDAGFEIRDTVGWVYGSGFPKSLDISKAIEAKVQTGKSSPLAQRKTAMGADYRPSPLAGTPNYGVTGNFINKDTNSLPMQISAHEAQLWDGWGTALKPAMELIVVAMKPLDGTFAENALKWGVAGYWIDGGRIGTEEHIVHGKEAGKFQPNGGETIKDYHEVQGRFPANLIHDGSDEVLELFPQTGKSTGGRIGNKGSALNMMGTNYEAGDPGYGDSGSAARFFYCAKASRGERNAGLDIAEQNLHPTVKPIALMRYLARITKTPTGGTVLDPFMGSGTTGIACALEGRDFIGIEKESEYYEIAKKRIAYWSEQPKLL